MGAVVAMLVTVPVPPVAAIVKVGYVPVTFIPVPELSTTTWSGAVFVTVMLPAVVIGPPETLMPVPAVRSTEVTPPPLLAVRLRSALNLFKRVM